MHIEYVGRQYDIDERTKGYVAKKLRKVLKFLEEPVEGQVTLSSEKHRQIAELHLSHRLGLIQATEESHQMVDSIKLAVEKAEKQARRARKKRQDRRRRAGRDGGDGAQWPVDVVEATSVREGGRPRVIKSSLLQIKPMSIEEAALQLDDSKNEFVVFRDAETGRVSVLYRRKDDNYGLIAPEF